MRSFSPCLIRAALLPLLLALVVGCGSDEDGESADGNSNNGDSNSAPPAPESADGSSDGNDADGTNGDPMMTETDSMYDMEEGDSGGEATDGTGNQTAAKFPEDFAEWKPDDFRNAARITHRRLEPAIEQLVDKTPGDGQTAELLAELLTLAGQSSNGNGNGDGTETYNSTYGEGDSNADPSDMDASTMPDASTEDGGNPMPGDYGDGNNYDGGFGYGDSSGQNGGDVRELILAIVNGLAKNNSGQAWQALTQVLTGQIKTVIDDRQMADWVLATALDGYGGVDHPTHELLNAALRNPESLNADRGAELRRQAGELILGTAVSVMDRLMGVPIPAVAARKPNGADGFSTDGGYNPMPNDGSGPMPNDGATPAYDENSGGEPMGSGNGEDGAPAPRRSALTRRPLSDEAMRNAIQYLWRAEMTSYVEENTRKIISLEDGVPLLALAGSLPTAGMRKATFDLLNGRWKEGADPLLSRGVYQSVARDPGLIVVLKQLPRLMPKGSLTNYQSATANPRAGKSQRESIAKHSWMKTSAYMVRAVTTRMQAATRKQSDPTLPDDLPIKLHRGARIRAVGEINWPADVSEFTSGVTPPGSLSLKYVRMELSQDIPKVFQHYKKQLRRGKDYKFPQGAWIDSLTAGAEPGTRRSIDVLFTQNTATNRAANQNGENGALQANEYAAGSTDGAAQRQNSGSYTVEILVVEISDPKLSAATP